MVTTDCRLSPSRATTPPRRRLSQKGRCIAGVVSVVASLLFVGVNPAPAAAADPECRGFGPHLRQYGTLRHRWETPSVNYPSADVGCTLRRGATGSAVLILQRSLNNCYNAGITESGYGFQTQQAVRWVQGTYGLQTDGIFGPVTNLHMKWDGVAYLGGEPISNFSRKCDHWWKY